MRAVAWVWCAVVWLVAASGGWAAGGGTVEKTIEVRGLKRTYRVHVPTAITKEKPAPVVLIFHGGGGTAKRTEKHTGFSTLADAEGFIAVYPDAVDRHWNDGREVERIASQRKKVDDVAFVSAILDALAREYCIDPDRVFATGVSNGGIFCHLLGAQLSERIAAIAPVIAGMAASVANEFDPARPISVLMIKGTKDPLVPFDGGEIRFLGSRGQIIGTKEAVAKWVAHDRCKKKPTVTELPDKDPKDGTRVEKTAYSGGKGDTVVVLYTIHGGGHTWPADSGRSVAGQSRDIDATKVIWEFFKSHPQR